MNNATKGKGEIATAQGPEVLKNHVIRFTWSTSRGRDTYGYNLLTLWEDGRKVASQCGGGYDMKGAAVADWLKKAYPVRLHRLARRLAGSTRTKDDNGYHYTDHASRWDHNAKKDNENYVKGSLYGLSFFWDTDKASLDGACGINSVCEVLKALGLHFREDEGNFNKRGGSKNSGVYLIEVEG